MRGQRVLVWHPDSSGSSLVVWRPWWKRKFKPFATLHEWGMVIRWHQRQSDYPKVLDVR